MKLAIVNQITSTGGWRYLYFLVKYIKKLQPEWYITIFISDINKIEEVDKLRNLGIEFRFIEESSKTIKPFIEKQKFKIKIINKISNIIRKFFYNHKRKRFIFSDVVFGECLNQYDVIFYSWPYGIKLPNISKPIFFIPHDFIFSHFFGFHSGHFYTREWWWTQRQQMEQFVEKGQAIVSTPYIKDEFMNTFPDSKKIPKVVYLSYFNEYEKKDVKSLQKRLKELDITEDYILYANNWALHKNMQVVIGAYYYIKQKYPNIKLIITGYGTDNIYCRCNSPYYLDHVITTEPYDVKSFGLLKDDDFSILLQGAKLVINSSLCEAGAGSALDAWKMGVPVVMSNIQPFKEQISFLGTKAELFDPRDSKDIARAILYLLDNPDIAKENVKISKKAVNNYSWEKVAQQYINIFEGK